MENTKRSGLLCKVHHTLAIAWQIYTPWRHVCALTFPKDTDFPLSTPFCERKLAKSDVFTEQRSYWSPYGVSPAPRWLFSRSWSISVHQWYNIGASEKALVALLRLSRIRSPCLAMSSSVQLRARPPFIVTYNTTSAPSDVFMHRTSVIYINKRYSDCDVPWNTCTSCSASVAVDSV